MHMRRSLVLFLPVAAVLAMTLAAGEDAKRKESTEKPATAEKGKPGKAVPFFDAADFVEEYDTNKDGFLSKDELPERFRHAFDKLDANKDGKLSQEELQKGFTHLQSHRRPSDFVLTLIQISDCDECCAEELQMVFDILHKLDKNKDGKIDADELKAGREQLITQRVDGIFKDLDRNKDGKISSEEARGHIKQHFNDLDRNKDGFISRDGLLTAAMEKPGTLNKSKGKEEK